jgi:HEPN domain-containing protein
MKSKNDHIDFWLSQAENDWNAVNTLYNGKNYLQSLFFAHLVIEKICKALWIKYNEGNVPPRTHNLNHLLLATPIELNDDISEFMLRLNRFQMEGRYPDYLTKMHEICNKSFTTAMIDETDKIRLWLLEKVR